MQNRILAIALLFVLSFNSCKKDGGNSTGTTPVVDLTDNGNMLMGNPTNALEDETNFNNYLMKKDYYTLSYSRTRAIPNWVSWHVQNSDLGSVDRSDDFRGDNTLPSSWYLVEDRSYSGGGFDRGHNCPSADRTNTSTANSSTFLMTNIIPQAPQCNQITWANMENYLRDLVTSGNELYVIMGNYGKGGTGNNGFAEYIDGNRVIVPSQIWKVVVVLPAGNGDINRITSATRVIAVRLQNTNALDADWKKYRTSVDVIERDGGVDLLSNLSKEIQAAIESKVDNK